MHQRLGYGRGRGKQDQREKAPVISGPPLNRRERRAAKVWAARMKKRKDK